MFSILFPKKNAVHTDLLRGTADVHSHLLPGVDDGVQSADDMQAALNAMQEAGVERVFLTPHVMADLPDNRRSYLQDRFACMKQFAPEGVELRLAAEYMLDAGFRLQMADGLLTYADRQVLVETSYLSPRKARPPFRRYRGLSPSASACANTWREAWNLRERHLPPWPGRLRKRVCHCRAPPASPSDPDNAYLPAYPP